MRWCPRSAKRTQTAGNSTVCECILSRRVGRCRTRTSFATMASATPARGEPVWSGCGTEPCCAFLVACGSPRRTGWPAATCIRYFCSRRSPLRVASSSQGASRPKGAVRYQARYRAGLSDQPTVPVRGSRIPGQPRGGRHGAVGRAQLTMFTRYLALLDLRPQTPGQNCTCLHHDLVAAAGMHGAVPVRVRYDRGHQPLRSAQTWRSGGNPGPKVSGRALTPCCPARKAISGRSSTSLIRLTPEWGGSSLRVIRTQHHARPIRARSQGRRQQVVACDLDASAARLL